MILCEIKLPDSEPQLARVRDLSEYGIKIATTLMIPAGTRIKVRLPASEGWCLARVAWQADGLAGIALARANELPCDTAPFAPARQA